MHVVIGYFACVVIAVLMYKDLIRPMIYLYAVVIGYFACLVIAVLMYMIYVYVNTRKFLYSEIRVAFNDAYRRIFGPSNRSNVIAMYGNYNIGNFEAELRNNIVKFIRRLKNRTNYIIQVLIQSW